MNNYIPMDGKLHKSFKASAVFHAPSRHQDMFSWLHK